MDGVELFNRVINRIAEERGEDREDVINDLANTVEVTLLERMSRTEQVVETTWALFKEEYGLSPIKWRDRIVARGFDDGTARVLVVSGGSMVHDAIWHTAATRTEWQASMETLWADAARWYCSKED